MAHGSVEYIQILTLNTWPHRKATYRRRKAYMCGPSNTYHRYGISRLLAVKSISSDTYFHGFNFHG